MNKAAVEIYQYIIHVKLIPEKDPEHDMVASIRSEYLKKLDNGEFPVIYFKYISGLNENYIIITDNSSVLHIFEKIYTYGFYLRSYYIDTILNKYHIDMINSMIFNKFDHGNYGYDNVPNKNGINVNSILNLLTFIKQNTASYIFGKQTDSIIKETILAGKISNMKSGIKKHIR